FDSKEDLFQQVVRWKHDDAYDELETRLAAQQATPDRLRTIVRGTFAFCARDPRVPQLMFQTTYGPVLSTLSPFLQSIAERRFGIVEQVMEAGLRAKELHGGGSRALALLFCSIMDYHAQTLSRLPDPDRTLTPALADALVDAFLSGVMPGRRKTPQLPATL
ncbi:MAG: TetR/AcrR family transcriptional regulator, partial [Planctomycetota bacterium]